MYDYRGGIQGTLKSGAYIFSDPVLGNVVSLNKSESWILMGNFSGTVHSLYVHKKRLSFESKDFSDFSVTYIWTGSVT